LNPILRKRVVAKGQNLDCAPSYLKRIDLESWNNLSKLCGSYFYNTPTIESIEIAEMKIDEVRPWPKLDEVRAYAQVIADKMLESALTAREWTNIETLEHLDLKKGVGIPLKYCGFKTRDQLFTSELWLQNYEDIKFLKDLLPFYESVGKEELTGIEDYYDKKSRTFQTTGAQLLYWQIRLYGQGNENLKLFKWSKYGFNPFYGGVNNWYKDIMVKDENGKLLYTVRICWDISGYDRKIWLHYVADRRFKFWCNANPNSKFKNIAEWVRDAWKRSILVFHNGDIVVRLRGNNSGSGTTTTNNIEAGFEVVADLLVYVYRMKYQIFPPEDLVLKQLIALYGDDNAMFIMSQFDGLLDTELVKQRLLHQHGLVCKWIVGGIEHPFSELQFLGFTISSYKNYKIPKWDLKRLVHPILFTPTKKTPGQYLQQVYSLLIMSFAHPDAFLEIRRIYLILLQHYQGSGQPDVKFMLNLGAPSHEDVENFYLGFESSNTLPIKYDGAGGGGPLSKLKMMSFKESKITAPNPKQVMPELNWCEKEDCAYSTFYHVEGFCDDLIRCPRGHVRNIVCETCAECTFVYTDWIQNANGTWHCETDWTQDMHRNGFNEYGNEQMNFGGRSSPYVDIFAEEVKEAHENRAREDIGTCENIHCLFYKDPHTKDQCYGLEKCPWGHAIYDMRFRCPQCAANRILTRANDTRVSNETKKRPNTPILEGSFNPYGNGQTADSRFINIFRPTYFTGADGAVSVTATVQYDDAGPQVLFGTGADLTSAFDEWEVQIDSKLEIWSPLDTQFIKDLQSLPKPDGPLKILWTKNANHIFKRIMEGSFNPYGNGQTTPDISGAIRYVQISAPTIVNLGGVSGWYCNYIVAIDGSLPTMYTSGTGDIDAMSAFITWLSTITSAFSSWAPVSFLRKTVQGIRKLPPPASDHPLSYIWTEDIDHTLDMIMEGFNPYGNGQPKMSQAAYMRSNKSNFDKEKLSHAARLAKYNEYLKTTRGGKTKVLTTIKQGDHSRIAPTKTQIRKAVNSQISVTGETRSRDQYKVARKLESGITRMSPCSRMYYASLVCPFYKLDDSCAPLLKSLRIDQFRSENPCIPTIPNVKSRKFSSFLRGDFLASIGANPGGGFIAFAPRRLAQDGVATNYNTCPIYASNINWNPLGVGSPYPILDVTAAIDTGVNGFSFNADYTSSQLPLVNGRGIKYRIVAAGLRIRYTGTEVNLAGTIHATIMPNHDTLSQGTVTQLGQLETYFRYPMTREWITIAHSPVMDDDFLYFPDSINNPTFFGTLFSTQSFQHYMGFQITDCAAGSFQWEAVTHYEVVGSEVRGLTPTPADLPGVSAVLSAVTPSLSIEVNKLSHQNKDIGGILSEGIQMVSGLGKELMPFAQMMMGAM